jgi:hypothetical protein
VLPPVEAALLEPVLPAPAPAVAPPLLVLPPVEAPPLEAALLAPAPAAAPPPLALPPVGAPPLEAVLLVPAPAAAPPAPTLFVPIPAVPATAPTQRLPPAGLLARVRPVVGFFGHSPISAAMIGGKGDAVEKSDFACPLG